MPATKIQDEAEVIRWFAEGRTHAWMAEEYERRYELQVVPSMFANFRSRRGMDRRITRDDDLIPWAVEKVHRHHGHVAMLRTVARERAGAPLRATDETRMLSWLAKRAIDNLVVDYDPTVGFSLVARRPGIDTDLIRVPERKTGRLSTDPHGAVVPRSTPAARPAARPVRRQRPATPARSAPFVPAAESVLAVTAEVKPALVEAREAAVLSLQKTEAELVHARAAGDWPQVSALSSALAYATGVVDVLDDLTLGLTSPALDAVLSGASGTIEALTRG